MKKEIEKKIVKIYKKRQKAHCDLLDCDEELDKLLVKLLKNYERK